jgi:phosphoribosylpyrophosphate synthetase
VDSLFFSLKFFFLNIISTNTIPDNRKGCDKIERISVALLIAEAIRRVQNNETLTELYE